MRRFAASLLRSTILAMLPGLLLVGAVGADTTAAAQKGKIVHSFTLQDSAGKNWSLADVRDKKAIVVVFIGTECPINNQNLPRLAEMYKRYSDQVAFFG